MTLDTFSIALLRFVGGAIFGTLITEWLSRKTSTTMPEFPHEIALKEMKEKE
jgi:hypothetical protein